jgi:hypothetical protein
MRSLLMILSKNIDKFKNKQLEQRFSDLSDDDLAVRMSSVEYRLNRKLVTAARETARHLAVRVYLSFVATG